PPPTSTLFPYTTLFRSRGPTRCDRCDWRACAGCETPTGSSVPRVASSLESRVPSHSCRRLLPDHDEVVRQQLFVAVVFELALLRSEEHTSELQSRSDLV